jgi:hypothetical protein
MELDGIFLCFEGCGALRRGTDEKVRPKLSD